MALTWDDLIIENITPDQFRRWIEPWSGVVTGQIAPSLMSRFGTWFLRRPEGYVDMLDVFTGAVERIADTYEGFIADVNRQQWQEDYLLSRLVLCLHEADMIPGPAECYALVPHPAFGGPNPFNGDVVDPQFVMVMLVFVWQSVCAQSVA